MYFLDLVGTAKLLNDSNIPCTQLYKQHVKIPFTEKCVLHTYFKMLQKWSWGKEVIKWECQWIWLRSKVTCSVWHICCVKCYLLEIQIISQPISDTHFPTAGVWKHAVFRICNILRGLVCKSAWGFRNTNPINFPWDIRSLSLLTVLKIPQSLSWN